MEELFASDVFNHNGDNKKSRTPEIKVKMVKSRLLRELLFISCQDASVPPDMFLVTAFHLAPCSFIPCFSLPGNNSTFHSTLVMLVYFSNI
jgi:hypothetical protein